MTERTPARPSADAQILELYKLAVEMADRVSARRASANSYFFTLQAGLAVGLGAFAVTPTSAGATPDRFVLTLAAIAGVILAASWWLVLRSYRDLNSAKFKVITQIEQDYLDIQLFEAEWRELRKDPVKNWRQRYAEQGQVERIVPVVFLLIYAALTLYVAFG